MYQPLLPRVAKLSQEGWRAEAARARLARLARSTRPPARERLLSRAGDLLIAAGFWLHRHARRPAPTCPRAYPSP